MDIPASLRAKLASLIRSNPQSTVGTVGNDDAYRQYAIDAQQNGQQPLTQAQWLQMQQSQAQVPQNGG